MVCVYIHVFACAVCYSTTVGKDYLSSVVSPLFLHQDQLVGSVFLGLSLDCLVSPTAVFLSPRWPLLVPHCLGLSSLSHWCISVFLQIFAGPTLSWLLWLCGQSSGHWCQSSNLVLVLSVVLASLYSLPFCINFRVSFLISR